MFHNSLCQSRMNYCNCSSNSLMKLLSLEGLTKIEYFIMIFIVTKVLIQKLKKKNGSYERKSSLETSMCLI